MNRLLHLLAIAVVSVGMNLAVVADADARRFGGARSLGGKSGTVFKRSADRPRSASQQTAAGQNRQAREQLAQRGGMMGMIGGLALGGLLGALFFGGAFEGFNFLDLLLFGGIAYLLFRMFAARRQAAAGAGPGTAAPAGWAPGGLPGEQEPARDQGARREAATAPGGVPSTGVPAFDTSDADFDDDVGSHDERPAGFDEREFLAGARRAFELLQQDWHTRNLDEIRALCTPELFAAIEAQANEPGADHHVQVLKVDAEMLDVRRVDGNDEAAVLFDAILREGHDERPAQVREIWHFTRPANAAEPRWWLEAIEQLEDAGGLLGD